MVRSVGVQNELNNAAAGRYGVKVVETADGVVEGPFAKLTVVGAGDLGAGTEVAGGEDLSGLTLPVGTVLEVYATRVEFSGTLVASYANAGDNPGQKAPYRATPLQQGPE